MSRASTDARPLSEYTSGAVLMVRQAGLRSSVGRAAIIGTLLQGYPQHLDVGEIHARLHDAGYQADCSGIYRFMTALAERDVVHVVPTRRATVFGLAHPRHHHAVCVACGGMATIPLGALDDAAAEVASIAAEHDFALGVDGLVLYGRCAACPAPADAR